MNRENENSTFGEIVVEDDLDLKIAQAQKAASPPHAFAERPTISSVPNMGAAVRDDFWLDDIRALLRSDRLSEFIPNSKHNVNEQLNALTRFFLYLGILVAFYRKSVKPFLFVSALPIACIAYYFLQGMASDHEHDSESFESLSKRPQRPAKRMHPTANNPYMNPDPTMYGTESYFVAPADVNDPVVRKEINDAFAAGEDMFLEEGDIWERKRGQLMFNTVPRQVDFGEFQDFLFQLPPETCKENTSNCTPAYRTPRANKRPEALPRLSAVDV